MLSLIEIVLLLAANGFYVAAEFALVKARGFRLESLADGGNRTAELTVRIQRNLEVYLAACQLGITMASLGLGWVGEPAVAALLEPAFHAAGVPEHALHTVAFLVGFLLFSSLHIVIGEQVPKTLAIRKAEPVSLWVAYPLHISYLLVWPLNWVLNRATRGILAAFGVEEVSHADVLTDSELKGLVATSSEHGELEEQKAGMLKNLFEFDRRMVSRVMIPRSSVVVLDLAASPENNAAIIRDSGHSRFPVVDGGLENIIGLVLAKDLYAAMLSGEQEPWRELARYCRQPIVAPESQLVAHVFDTMRARRAHMAFVVDEYGELTGIVTLEDLLEEIVGEIHDETDAEQPAAPIMTFEDHWEASGLVSISDVERAIGLTVPDELDANTLSGLFMQRLGRMPEAGDVILESGFRLQALTIIGRRVGEIRIDTLPDAANAGEQKPDEESDSVARTDQTDPRA